MQRMNKLFLLLILFFSDLVLAGKTCELHPDNFDKNNSSSVNRFEENIEKRMTEIYRRDYPELVKSSRKAYRLEKSMKAYIVDFSRRIIGVKPIGPRKSFALKSKYKALKAEFDRVLAQDEPSYVELMTNYSESSTGEPPSKEEFDEFLKEREELRKEVEKINDWIAFIKTPHFLYKPKVQGTYRKYKDREGIFFSNLRMEAFFRPPSESILKIPVLNFGFEANENTVIYACVNLDAFDKTNNGIYIYFLNTTKMMRVTWSDYLLKFDLALRDFFSFSEKPKARIAPAPFNWSPTRGVSGVLNTAIENFSFLAPFAGLNDILQRVGVQIENANIVEKFIMNAIGIGPQGIYVDERGFVVRWGISTLFGLWNEEFAKHRIKKDLSVFMNVLTRKGSLPPIPLANESTEN